MIQLDILDPRAVEECSQATTEGVIWAACLGEVYAICCDGFSDQADRAVREAKGDGRGALAALLSGSWVPTLADFGRVYQPAHQSLADADWVQMNFGNTAFLRYFLNRKVSAKSLEPYPWLLGGDRLFQQFSFRGRPEAYRIEKACAKAVHRQHNLASYTPPVVGITSMNFHGQPSICDPNEAVRFCQTAGIQLLIHNAASEKRGSYPIVSVGPNGSFLEREGNLPAERVLCLLPGMRQR